MDPITCHCDGLRGRCTCGIDLSIWPFCTNKLGKLRMPHCQDLKEKAAVKPSIRLPIVLYVVDEICKAWEGTCKDDSRVVSH